MAIDFVFLLLFIQTEFDAALCCAEFWSLFTRRCHWRSFAASLWSLGKRDCDWCHSRSGNEHWKSIRRCFSSWYCATQPQSKCFPFNVWVVVNPRNGLIPVSDCPPLGNSSLIYTLHWGTNTFDIVMADEILRTRRASSFAMLPTAGISIDSGRPKGSQYPSHGYDWTGW